MTNYGGMGGIKEGRPLNESDAFEMAVYVALGNQIRAKHSVACDMWCALANVDWKHDNGDEAGYTFRAAGDLVAAIKGSGNYMHYYCCGPDAVVSDEIEKAMAKMGWHPFPDGDYA